MLPGLLDHGRDHHIPQDHGQDQEPPASLDVRKEPEEDRDHDQGARLHQEGRHSSCDTQEKEPDQHPQGSLSEGS